MSPQLSEIWLPLSLFSLFTLLSVVGAYLIVAHSRGRRMALLAAALTALFFAGVAAGVLALMRGGGLL